MTPSAKATSPSKVKHMPPPAPSKGERMTNGAEAKAFVTKVYCTLCTRTVEAVAEFKTNGNGKKHMVVQARQRCPRCGAFLDAAFVLCNLPQAA